MLQEKQFFLSCLQDGPLDQRKIANRMSRRFATSPAAVKDALLAEGLIELSHTQRLGSTQKINHYFVLTGKKIQSKQTIQKPWSDKWEDGTLKSTGNAFDLFSKPCTLFNKSELAQMHQKYNNKNPITIYTRA
jgi:hypothetical protein